MKNALLILIICALGHHSFGQNVTGKELLDKAISYHDPNGNWPTFNATFFVSMDTPKGPSRDSKITINLPEESFFLKAKHDTLITEYQLTKGDCTILLNGSEDLSEETLKEHNLSCDRALLYKNYYTYLYGLPMKLKDPGTIIRKKVTRQKFKGKEYLVLQATYDDEVGSDVWFFYFDPTTYAMEVYQFFKGDPDGKGKGTGEYILLSEEAVVNEIKMPAVRAWYYNKNDEYLGTDRLTSEK